MKPGMNEPDTSGYDLWGLSDCYHICENVIMKDGQRSGSRHLVEANFERTCFEYGRSCRMQSKNIQAEEDDLVRCSSIHRVGK